MTVQEIITKWLTDKGYEGLFALDECGCEVSDLMPCGEWVGNCEPGYKVPCPGAEDCWAGGDCEFHIGAKKPENDKCQI